MSTYADHIVGFERMAPGDLGANPANFRVHPDGQRTSWRAIAEKVGWLGALIWNRRTGHLIDGHLRLEEALASGQETVPVLVVDCDPDTEAQGLLTFDAMGELAEKDDQALDALLREVGSMGPELDAMLADLANSVGLYDDKPAVVEDEVPEAPADPVTQPGDVWLLGRHRLICGDCTDAEVVARVMAGAKAHLLWADPPFGISYTGHGASEDGAANKFDPIAGDEKADASWLGHCLPGDGGAVYLKTTWRVLRYWEDAVGAACCLRSRITWDKQSHVAGDVQGGYATRSEIVLFGSVGRHKISKFDTDVWEIARATTGSPDLRTGHPYESPVELPARAIGNSSEPGGIILDPFLGSGTTLIAAEQLGRVCYGCEISPVYCDVIVRRWEALTGQAATREVHSCG